MTIYRASAGSGKTYALTAGYIKLLLLNVGNPHRRILAVTFTNKATEEMKSRIVRDLHKIATGNDPEYSGKIAKETGISEKDLPSLASKTLAHLLHDYSHFSILTIDSFFQRIIRSFAREMGLYAGYEVELDQNLMLNESTDLMLDEIDQNEYLKNWLIEWAKRKIEEGKSWNFKYDLLKLGSEIFSEELQNIDPELLRQTYDKESLDIFRKKLLDMTDKYWDIMQNYGQLATDIMDRYELNVDSFAWKKTGVGGFFRKYAEKQEKALLSPNSYVMKALDNIESWYSKKSPQKQAIIDAHSDGLGEILKNMTDYHALRAREISSANIILKQINILGIICDLIDYTSKYARDKNLFLLPEASGFIKKIIAGADAPFIYERTGSFYNHFMIDEFQDTSLVQWENFRPLIANSIASGYQNWIVGDVKQSIYRWRNTDWKILSEKVENDLKPHKIKIENLDRNWRSSKEIVHFNNAFFRQAVLQMSAAFLTDEKETADTERLQGLTVEITEAFRDSYQYMPERQNEENGYVLIEMIDCNDNEEEETWREKVLQAIPGRIEHLQDLGYCLSDIAIVVRENKEAQDVADKLLECRQENQNSKYRYDVLSNESLLINNAPEVKWLVAAMRYIIEPDDKINCAYLIHEYETYLFPGSKIQGLTSILESVNLRCLPVFELAEKLIKEYNLHRDAGFLEAFQDILLHYSRRNATDIRSFLNWWEDEKNKKYLAMPVNQDAIRLITIHKSKGLEFKAVIIPFCDWPLCKSGKTLWCRPVEAPFSDMKLLPLKFGKTLKTTVFVNDYLHEKMMSYIDNLNLLYVAFTRARNAMFVSMPLPKSDSFNDVKNLINRVFNEPLLQESQVDGYVELNDYWNSEGKRFEFGKLE